MKVLSINITGVMMINSIIRSRFFPTLILIAFIVCVVLCTSLFFADTSFSREVKAAPVTTVRVVRVDCGKNSLILDEDCGGFNPKTMFLDGHAIEDANCLDGKEPYVGEIAYICVEHIFPERMHLLPPENPETTK